VRSLWWRIARCARLSRPLGSKNATIEVDHDGRPLVHASVPVYASIAHSADSVAAIVSGDPIGVDLESTLRKRDLGATAMLSICGDEASNAAAILRAWITAEARLKSRPRGKFPGLGI
jgi:phosphopantetheinyl transferase